jgi:hypothetical protein
MKKSVPIALLTIFTINLFISNSIIVNCWQSGETITTITLNEPPTIDGIKDEVWLEGNSSTFQLNSSIELQLTVLINDTNLYILVEILDYALLPGRTQEWVSLYFSRNITEGEDNPYIDKKQMVMYNASLKGQEHSMIYDHHEDDVPDEYINDSTDEFTGKAGYGSGVNRNYEYKIKMNPSDLSENVNLTKGNTYYLKIGYQYDMDNEEIQTIPIILNIKLDDTDPDDGLFAPFEVISHYIVIGIMIVLGISIIRSKPKSFSKKDVQRGVKQ